MIQKLNKICYQSFINNICYSPFGINNILLSRITDISNLIYFFDLRHTNQSLIIYDAHFHDS